MQVPVYCNGLSGLFDRNTYKITTEAGQDISTTQFEEDAGRGRSKKWKVMDDCWCKTSGSEDMLYVCPIVM